jgi:hypothetical protein
MIRRIDAWVGLRLFHPPIIWLCQRTGVTQWAFYRYAWWIYALWAVWRDDHRSTSDTVWLVLFALIRTVSAGLSLNSPAPTSLVLRCLLWVVLAWILFPPLVRGDVEHAGMQLLILAAEYATTIRTIPPRKKRQPAQRSREAWA